MSGKYKAKKCPFLQPFETKDKVGTREKVEQDCMRERCELWADKENRCSIPTLVTLLKKK